MESLRSLLLTYAYNILGSLETAEDVVQDAYVQWMRVDEDTITDKKAYLVRMVINLAINQKKRQKKIIKEYPGQWLPEPVATEGADATINRKEVLSYSMMILLEKLNAKQRAVFILKEAFDYEHSEIAGVLNITTEHSRKLLSRAKKQLEVVEPVASYTARTNLLHKYLQVIQEGDTRMLEELLNEDIAVISDGGGKAAASMNPVAGKKQVTAMLLGLYKKFYTGSRIEEGEINHHPALFYYEGDQITNCQIFSLDNGLISGVFFVRNPNKLKLLQKTKERCHA